MTMGSRIAVVALGMLGFGVAAEAVPITGGINFTGGLSTGSVALPLTTQFFFNAPDCVSCTQRTEGLPSGSYAAVLSGTSVAFQNFVFKPNLPGPVVPLWTLEWDDKVYSFDMTSVTSNYIASPKPLLDLFGTGIAKIRGLEGQDIGFEDTFSSFSLTTQDLGAGTGTFSFSASTSTEDEAAPVPEPGTMLLLGTGLTGLVLRRRRQAASLARA